MPDPRAVHEAATEFTLAEVARHPLPGMAHPDGFAFSPDGSTLTWLADPSGGMTNCLFAYGVGTGETRLIADAAEPGGRALTLEQALRRERTRTRSVGITEHTWSQDGCTILVPLGDDVALVDPATGAVAVVPVDGEWFDPVLSPDATKVAFVREDDVWVVSTSGSGPPWKVSHGDAAFSRGVAEFVAQEELDRYRGFWWSPDSSALAVCEVDESPVAEFAIPHWGAGDPTTESHRYPFAGTPNARVRLGVFALAGGPPVWLDLGGEDAQGWLGGDDGGYLARVDWLPDLGLVVQVLDRRQQNLRLLVCDPLTGACAELLTESSAVWINLHDCLRPLGQGGAFLWASERSGFRHLETRDADGTLMRELTSGPWEVVEVCGVDLDRRLVYFTATAGGVLERHLYRVPLDGGEVERVTDEAGWHTVTVDDGCDRFVDVHSSLSQPPTVTLRACPDGAPLHVIHAGADPRIDGFGLEPPELVDVTARDGTTLHAALYRPEGQGPHPVVVECYGGPCVQMVGNAWPMTVDLRAQWLRRRGFCVLVLDNRGSLHRGVAFEGALRRNLGDLEVSDQADGVRWLAAAGIGDSARVGVYGWSYGGYLAAMCLARAPDVFHAAVAGAPVTSWDGYDTAYTERYMGLPDENPGGYESSSVMAHVRKIRGDLLLVHGMIDENVHFRHTARLVEELTHAGVPYTLMVFPGERHMPRGDADRLYMEERIAGFLESRLLG